MSELRQNLVTLVNSAKIRRNVMYNNRSHTVVTSMTLPFDVVMNRVLYTKEQILSNYMKLDGTPAPIGHPKDSSGRFISAKTQEGRNMTDVGAWNRNPQIVGNRVQLETWIDDEVAGRTAEGRELLSRLEKLDPISTSVAVIANAIDAPSGVRDYDFIADIQDMDHNAFLFHEPPACGTENGVGIFVNADQAVEVGGEQSLIEKVYNAVMSKFKDKNLIVNEEEKNKMSEELKKEIEALKKENAELKEKSKKAEDKGESEIKANELFDGLNKKMEKIEGLLMANTNKELAEKRAKVAVILGNEEVVKNTSVDLLDAILARSGKTHSILGNHQDGSGKQKTPEELANETYGGEK